MVTPEIKSGFAQIDNASIYYEVAGKGLPFVMIHAGVADSRQWNNEFAYFSQNYQVIRYDMRGFGKSEPVDGDFSSMSDLVSLLDALEIHGPLVVMGCSMGGGLAIDFALTYPARARALILVGSSLSGLELDVAEPPKFAEAEKAYDAGNFELLAELEARIWFDGMDRAPEQVNPAMRKLLLEMNRLVISNEVKHLGKRQPNTKAPAFDRLGELNIPVLVIVGSHDVPYILAAADYMTTKIKSAKKAIIVDAAHLPNMDQPDEFRGIVKDFLESLSG